MNIFPYLVGSIVSIVGLLVLRRFIKDPIPKESVTLTQSYTYNLLKNFLVNISIPKPMVTQATEYEKTQYIPVIMMDKKAYWILNNTLFEADEVDGAIDKDTTRPVDTMGMNKIQLDKTIFIVESLTKGKKNDNWSSGH
jgi:hypothetical protein